MSKEIPYCQSCAMPLLNPEDFGTEKDGTENKEYCRFCYQNGSFTSEETMEQMIETCIPFALKSNVYPDAETARAKMMEYFPQLGRWKQNG